MRIGDGYTGPDTISTTAWVTAAVVLSIGLALTAAGALWQQHRASTETRSLQDRQIERLHADLVRQLTMPVYGLRGARGTLAALEGRASRTAFRAYVGSRDLPREFPGVRGFGFIERVEQADLDAFVAARRRGDAPDFQVHDLGQGPTHYIVTQIEPLERNAQAWGADSGALVPRRQAIERAIDSGEVMLFGPLPLMQDPQKGPGFLMLVPVYRQAGDPGSPAERRAALLGVLYAPFVASELLKGTADQAAQLLDLKLSARASGGEFAPLLATRQGQMLPLDELPDYTLGDAPTAESVRFTIDGCEFELDAALTHDAAARLLGLSGVGLALGGSLLSLLLAVTVYLLAAGRARAEEMARGMTADLARLAKVASGTTNAVLILDTGHCITWVNDGFTRMTGYTLADAQGQRPDALLHSDRTNADTVHGMFEAMNVGMGCTGELCKRAKDGRYYWADIEIQPLRGTEGELTGFMVIESDITARKALQAQADEARQSLQDLYDNAPCAYYALDGNGRFLQINALGLSWLGCTAEELIGRTSPRDFFSPEGQLLFDEAFPRFIREGRVSGLEFDLTGRQGRTRRVSLSATAIYDAGGAFLRSRSVMFDISETHRIRQQLHQLTLDQQAMLESDLVGIVKLRDRRSVWHNRALERMFGYDAEELHDAPARLLYPDDTAFQTLGLLAYPQLRSGGRFRTQQQMRRKDGSLIWVDISGVELPGSGGATLWMMLDITQRKAHEERMERAALHDALTGLPNRLLLADRLRQAIHSAERSGHVFALAYLDLNGFKEINDTHGHDAGDEVLKVVAARLQAGLRASDTVARLGGDEFVVLLTPEQAAAEAGPALSRMLDALSRPITLSKGVQVAVGSSLGLAHFPADGRSPDELMRHADEAMFANKRSGRARASTG
ncbi:CHASE domain-containing protein [Roseateles saccharophilus]|uniref:PAS domain S-box-containing protein/diguanylate cyclase (GGDEF)-like protein n=1 Tax=Roseateles saccharophilus TaxID=304 RepID=A0A4R3VEU9_ROSSA|nr:CHASE domain-containing protein [Roseateles saccharophilus]MDG0834986.1 diguanylate cyclase [Roseateles saccharophilus]TCV02159.1 PAS domain S-box-containing protein/diguanylate cyclase (GGDEF)-like protein [Roseateles saccharophilus]